MAVLDARDAAILRALLPNPRASLREIVEAVRAEGMDISAETVRRRLLSLEKVVSFHPVPDLKALGMEGALLFVRVQGGAKARDKVVKRLVRWHPSNITETVGRYDIAATIPVRRPGDLAACVLDLRGLPEVQDIEYLLVSRSTPLMDWVRASQG
ncbi:MAG: Lrp/AsnC family transcriptional regulator [Halobacteriales archaeon]|nr:Lrp/AsnC family transcriptional regulator [Halobacteriales archaeon]